MTEDDDFDVDEWLAQLPATFDDESIGGLSVEDCERIEENPDLIGAERYAAYQAYTRKRFGNIAKAVELGVSPGLTQLRANIAKLSQRGTAASKFDVLARAHRLESPRPDFDSMIESMAEESRERERERLEQRQREIDTLGALRGIQGALTEQNARSRRAEWVQDATLGLALIGVVAAIGALAWALYEDRSTAVWTSVATLLVGATVLALLPRVRRRRSLRERAD